MIAACKALPRSRMQDYAYRKESALASLARGFDSLWIVSVSDPFSRPIFGEMGNVLPLAFEDIDADDMAVQGLDASACVLFRPEQADRVCAFVRRAHAAPGRGLFAADCFAGVSRSGAIASFAADVCGVDGVAFARMNPRIAPNRYVYRLLAEAWSRA